LGERKAAKESRKAGKKRKAPLIEVVTPLDIRRQSQEGIL